jgi:hypothetical protein
MSSGPRSQRQRRETENERRKQCREEAGQQPGGLHAGVRLACVGGLGEKSLMEGDPTGE